MNEQKANREDFDLEKAYEKLSTKTLEEVISDGESEWELDPAHSSPLEAI